MYDEMVELFSTPIQLPASGHQMDLSPVAFLETDVTLLDDHDSNLDIDNMSYEELLEYFEQIDNVSRGLLEETITRVVKFKTCLLPNNLDGITSEEQESDLCVICQDEYKNKEEIGILPCQHKYHTNCIRKWLHEKNVCPVCRSEVLDFDQTLN
ncbi:probable E3 ubiquitin-protein ligase HIP1 [Vigna radiata var. radiata]|uniref:RING-type E3 ubiquitin transferase n=1 Tax=Vigna radiata var. radiata TaxID=3916 RepID=A0A1S3TFI6_VIGRR|nr:probable E3 ubiquitin-protein ligase HIP1 [Vigna radiata var. radiata]